MNLQDDNPMKCHADVVWCQPTEREFAAGLRFSVLSDEQNEAIQRYLDDFMIDKVRRQA